MASASNTATQVDGNSKTTANYSVDTSGFGYSIITDDIRTDFDFLINSLPNKLDEVLKELDSAVSISDGFYFEGSGQENDISKARDEIKTDIENLKTSLADLHSAFMTDIDNINAELEYNFGWIIIGEVKGSQRTETVETAPVE